MSEKENPFRDQKKLLGDVPNPVIIDGGAHVGYTVVEYLKQLPAARIYAFEPFQESIDKFRKNLPDNPRVELVPLCLAESSGKRAFYINGYLPTNSLLPRPVSGTKYYPEQAATIGETQVECVTLDEFIESRGIEDVHILKLDIQGAELMALRGAEHALAAKKFRVLFLEIAFVSLYESGVMYFELAEFLASYGYSIYKMYDFESADDGQLQFCNAIFLSDEARAELARRMPGSG